MSKDFISKQDKLDRIDRLAEEINKKHGEEIITSMPSSKDIQVFSTRIPSLDIKLGVGGIAKGRLTEFYGPEKSGKTTTALQVCATAQEQGAIIVYIDAEHAMDFDYAKIIGLDVSDKSVVLIQPEWGEQALNSILKFLEEGLVDLVVIDSLASLQPKSLMDAIKKDGLEKTNRVGDKARMLSKFIDSAISRAYKTNCAILALQQMRTQIGGPATGAQVSASPLAIKHESSVRVRFRKSGIETMKGNTTDETIEGIHQTTLAKVEKNKVGKPLGQSLFDITFGVGACYSRNLLNTCVANNLPDVDRSTGAWFTVYNIETGEQYGKKFRESQCAEWASANPEMMIKLNNRLSEAVSINLYDPFNPSKEIGPMELEEVPEDISSIVEQEPEENIKE